MTAADSQDEGYELQDFARPEQRSPILTLPNELLHKILLQPEVPVSTVFDMSFLCRRLHQMCLSLYLSRRGIPDPAKRCDIRNLGPALNPRASLSSGYRHDVLQALRLSSDSMTSVAHLSCAFPAIPSGKVGKDFVDRQASHLKRLERFVRKLDSVSTVELCFERYLHADRACCHWCPTAENYGPSDCALLGRWTQGFGDLLDAIVERGCTSLAVSGPAHVMKNTYGLEVYDEQTLFRYLSAAKRALNEWGLHRGGRDDVLEGPNWRFRRIPRGKARENHLVELSPAAAQSSALKHITIGTSDLLYPPLLQWLYSILLASPVESLAFSDFRINNRVWPIVCTLLARAVPDLNELAVHGIGEMKVQDLNALLEVLPSVTSLSIKSTTTYQSSTNSWSPPLSSSTNPSDLLPRESSQVILQNLEYLAAPPAQILLFASYATLNTVVIIWDRVEKETIQRFASFHDVRVALSRLSDAFLPIHTGVQHQLSRQCEVTLRVVGTLLPPSSLENDYGGLEIAARCVTHLDIIADSAGEYGSLASRQATHAMRFYLQHFPNVVGVKLTVMKGDYTTDGLPIGVPLTNALEAGRKKGGGVPLEWYEYNGARVVLHDQGTLGQSLVAIE